MTADAVSGSPHGVNLPVGAAGAWSAYCAMLESKQAHFGFLTELHTRYLDGGQRTLAEAAYLEQLLATHDRAVAAFAASVRELNVRDRAAHAALIAAITSLNATLGNEAADSAPH